MKKILFVFFLMFSTCVFSMPGKREFIEYLDNYSVHYVMYGENQLFVIKVATNKNKWQEVSDCEWTPLIKNKGVYRGKFISFENNDFGLIDSKKLMYSQDKIDLALYKMNCRKV